MSRIRNHLTYANVVATLALIIAVAGGTTAIAITAAKNSVTTKSIRDGNVTAKDLGRIRSIAERGQLSDPVSGDGTPGSAFAIARCPSGSQLLGGGVLGGEVVASAPVSGKRPGWQGSILSDAGPTGSVKVTALCLLRRPTG
jgi:hypothetical protein